MCLVCCTKDKLLVPISSISVIIAELYLFGWYSLKNTSQKSIWGSGGEAPRKKIGILVCILVRNVLKNYYFGMTFCLTKSSKKSKNSLIRGVGFIHLVFQNLKIFLNEGGKV